MVGVGIVNETSAEANWNRRADRQTSKPMCREAAPPKMYVILVPGPWPKLEIK